MNQKPRRNGKKRIVAFLLMISLVVTTGTFAYWSSYVEGTQEQAIGTLTVGSADSVDTTFVLSNELNSGGYLVPEGQLGNSLKGSVEQIDLSYDVAWNEDAETTQLIGTKSEGRVSITHDVVIKLDGEVLNPEEYSNIYELINVVYDANNPETLILDADAQTYSYHITMDEPADQEEYHLISNATVSITFTYTILDNFIETTDVSSK